MAARGLLDRSGATPMVAGSAALLLEAFKGATPAEIKARLMNTSDTHVLTAPNLFGNQLAPATRIGAGEVRVDRALAAKTLAFVAEDESAAISFGYAAIASRQEFRKNVQVFNPTNAARTYAVAFSFRDAANPGVAAVSARVPSSIQVPARGLRELEVRITVDPAKLQTWTLNGGSQGGNGQLLTQLELDGHVTLSDKLDTVSLPWSLVAHRAADVRTEGDEVELEGRTSASVQLRNGGAADGRVEVFAWTGSSKKISRRLLPKPGDNFAVIDLGQVGVRLAGSAVQFGITPSGSARTRTTRRSSTSPSTSTATATRTSSSSTRRTAGSERADRTSSSSPTCAPARRERRPLRRRRLSSSWTPTWIRGGRS